MKTVRKFQGALIVGLLFVVCVGVALATALSADRDTPRRDGGSINMGVAVANTIYAGAIVAVDSTGYAVPASADNTLVVLGRAEAQADNSDGASGDLSVDIGTGVYRYGNQAGVGNIASDDDIGKFVYVVDDATVSLSDSSGTRPVAGLVVDVDSSGVWVDFGGMALSAIHAGLLNANSVGPSEIQAGAVGTSEVEDGSLTADDLAADSVGTSEVIDGTLVNADISGTAEIAVNKIANCPDGQVVMSQGNDRVCVAASGMFAFSNAAVATPVTEAVTAANVIAASECGKVFYLSSETEFASTLPTVSTVTDGCRFTFIINSAPSGASYTVTTGNSLENVLQGSVFNGTGVDTQAAGDTVTFTDGASVIGDILDVWSNAVYWFVRGHSGADTGIAISQAD